ncbi:MAG: penicillin-binding protein 2 [Burkholderia sp.]|nr:penicillin-binding protein 2 [Burkholderia sp.]
MTDFNDVQQLSKLRLRFGSAGVFVLICFVLLAIRFFYLQVLEHSKYALQADKNRISIVPIVPNRGLIVDRNGIVLAKNCSIFTLEITPSKLNGVMDNIIKDLDSVIEINAQDKHSFKKLLNENLKHYSKILPIRIRLTDQEVARFTAQRFQFPGIDLYTRLFRQYPFGPTAAHVIGYIGQISKLDQDKIYEMSKKNRGNQKTYDSRLEEKNYKGTSYIGKTGIEQSYETELHGVTGFEKIEVTASGRPVRTLSRIKAISGNNIILSIDICLQKAAQHAFAGRHGALVAIEPKTGDVLAFVSEPSFDPNLFVKGINKEAWDKLNNSEDKPLLNRPLSGTYPPGSTYKPFIALAGLTLGKRNPNEMIYDPGYFTLCGHIFHNDVRTGQGFIDLTKAITVSNDTYFYTLAHDIGVTNIENFMKPWGFGQLTNIDISGEVHGVLPSLDWKYKAFKKLRFKKWYDGDTISLGIGQGYNSYTILQLAYATATLANDGIVMKPHFIKQIEDLVTHRFYLAVPKKVITIPLKNSDVDIVKHGLKNVIQSPSGTAYSVFQGAKYLAAGKTGTAQVFSLKDSNYKRYILINRLRDHSLFIAYAPIDHPMIALALIVENGGWGSKTAAPIARRVLDFFFLDRKKRKNKKIAIDSDMLMKKSIDSSIISINKNKPTTIASGYIFSTETSNSGKNGRDL